MQVAPGVDEDNAERERHLALVGGAGQPLTFLYHDHPVCCARDSGRFSRLGAEISRQRAGGPGIGQDHLGERDVEPAVTGGNCCINAHRATRELYGAAEAVAGGGGHSRRAGHFGRRDGELRRKTPGYLLFSAGLFEGGTAGG